jgi:hypothetical protein
MSGRRKVTSPIFFLTDFSCGSWDGLGVVARPCNVIWELAFSGLCVCSLCGSGGSGGRRVPLALVGRYR